MNVGNPSSTTETVVSHGVALQSPVPDKSAVYKGVVYVVFTLGLAIPTLVATGKVAGAVQTTWEQSHALTTLLVSTLTTRASISRTLAALCVGFLK
jgi:hypothetical protein